MSSGHIAFNDRNFLRNFFVPYADRYIYIHQYFMILSLKQVEKISKALGDANRLKILQHISKKGGCGQCAEIQGIVDLAQPSISHHIKILLEAGLIEAEKEGRNHKYNLNEQLIKDYTAAVNMIK
jgi:ArsR family transcriptional regulator, arsenate/arsenite/antimonite-responsive transcriptional repressor